MLSQYLFKVPSKEYPKWLYLRATKHHIDRWTREISAKATSMGHIKREDLENAEVVIPNEGLFNNANVLFESILDFWERCKLETLILRNLLSIILQ